MTHTGASIMHTTEDARIDAIADAAWDAAIAAGGSIEDAGQAAIDAADAAAWG